MTIYKKLNNIITLNYDNDEYNNITLSYNDSSLYFGMEDQDGNYEGNLTQTRYDISSNYDGCSAYTINEYGSTTGSALLIVCNITKNNSQGVRVITYEYRNTPLFKINQFPKTIYINELYMYAVELSGSTNNYFIFNENQQDFLTLVTEEQYTSLNTLLPDNLQDPTALICMSRNGYGENVEINGITLNNAITLGYIISKTSYDDPQIETNMYSTIVYGESYNICELKETDNIYQGYNIYKVRAETTNTPYNRPISLFYCTHEIYDNNYFLYEHVATWQPSSDCIPFFYFTDYITNA